MRGGNAVRGAVMATVFPDKLSFYRGLATTQQRLPVAVEGEHIIITVDPPAPGSEFQWNADILVGGPGQDTVSYRHASAGVEVHLTGSASGEGHDVLSGFENAI